MDLNPRWLALFAASAAPLFAQLAPPNECGVTLGHIHLNVTEPEEHSKLWLGLLGGKVAHAGSLEMFQLPGIFIVAGKGVDPPSAGSDGSTVNHFGFLVPSYSDIKAKLAALDLPLFMDNPNNRQVIAVFPDKIRVEFTEDAGVQCPVFHHVHLSSAAPEKLRDWYVRTFGARAGTRGAFLAAMIPGGEVDFRKAPGPQAPTKGRALDHIGFEVRNLAAFCRKLQADGIAFDLTYRELPQLGGLKIAFLTDPEGTRIELTEGLGSH